MPVEEPPAPGTGEDTTKSPDESEPPASATGDEPESVGSVVASIHRAVDAHLHGPKQWGNALIASVFGIALLLDGDFCLKGLVVAAMFFLAMILAENEVIAWWGSGVEHKVRVLVGLEAGVAAALLAWMEIRAVMLVVGAMLGACAAHGLAIPLLHMYPLLTDVKWFIAAWYSVITVGVAAMVHTRKHVGLLALLTPILGGALISSSVCWYVTTLAMRGQLEWIYTRLPGLVHGEGEGAWVDFLNLMLFKNSPDVGIFVGSSYKTRFFGEMVPTDRACAVALWVVLAVLGAALQCLRIKCARKWAATRKKEKAANTQVQSLAEPLVG